MAYSRTRTVVYQKGSFSRRRKARTDHLPKMPKRFTDLQLQFAWLRAGIESAKTKQQVKEALGKGKRLVRDAEGSDKRVARASQRTLGVCAKKRLTLLSETSAASP